jgi:TonB-dependent receptor
MNIAYIKAIFLSTFCLIQINLLSQSGLIKGTVIDAKTGETLIGASVFIQGTTIGTVTDLDGNYVIRNISAGSYNIISSYISYDQKIQKAEVLANSEIAIDFLLDPATVAIKEIQVTARKRNNTEMSMLASIKNQDLIVSGISGQQIQKSQDKDAAEVLRRIPGITIVDDRFIIVRGLMQRYNSVLLNGATAPSSESDVRAFSFDLIPSNMVDNILIYKTPAPELPADFAGACINVVTKNSIDANSAFVGITGAYTNHTTFNDFKTYKGGQTDWLGIDDGSRSLPENFPSGKEMNEILELRNGKSDIDKLNKLAQSFQNNDAFGTSKINAMPNLGIQAGLTRRFIIGNVTVGNITSISYSNSNKTTNVFRSQFEQPDTIIGTLGTKKYNYTDNTFDQAIKAGIIHNWLIAIGNNHKIEFRNFLNQNTNKKVIDRTGIETYSEVDTIKGLSKEFNARTTYSGQLAGKSILFNNNTEIDWLAGYSIADKQQPDIRRLFFSKQLNDETNRYEYRFRTSGSVQPYSGSRFFQTASEKIYNGALNIKQNFSALDRVFVIKTGVFFEKRMREFEARNIGLVVSGQSFSLNLFKPIDSLIRDSNMDYNKGFSYSENYRSDNSYHAESNTLAPYLGLKIPFTKSLNLYTGVRVEKYSRILSDFQLNQAIVPNIKLDTTDVFFSSNLTYNINEKNLLRLSYGRTVNRPEFREIAPYSYNDFENKATIYGNDTLKNCYINNIDFRYEWYPSVSEIVSLAFFYKKFEQPIEIVGITSGNGWNFQPINTSSAISKGIELDIRKDLIKLGNYSSVLRYLKNFIIVFNASIIDSKINTGNVKDVREKERPMMGQSPYIINTGIYYQSDKARLMVSIIFNRIGDRIVTIGQKEDPHTWELSRNGLDFTLTKGFSIGNATGFEFKLGIKDLLNEPIHKLQYHDITLSSNEKMQLKQTIYKYYPGTTIAMGVSYKF